MYDKKKYILLFNVIGIRSVSDSSNEAVWMSGFTWVDFEIIGSKKTNYGGFIYQGPLVGGGKWYGNFMYPSYLNHTVAATYFYGPDNYIYNNNETFRAVGNYETFEQDYTEYAARREYKERECKITRPINITQQRKRKMTCQGGKLRRSMKEPKLA